MADRGASRRTRLGDARLYLCTDGRRDRGDLAGFLDAALRGGVDIVQIREKGLEAQAELELIAVAAQACARYGALLAVNDRVDLALIAGADVVHVGQDDLTLAQARRIVGDAVLVGLSTHGPAQADAVPGGLDYACVGPVWTTPTKPGRPAVGLEAIGYAATRLTALPWFAIGGIEQGERLDAVLAAGARRIVVVRAVTEAEDPEAAARALRDQLAAAD